MTLIRYSRKRVIGSAIVVEGTTLKWSFRKVSEIVDDFEQMAHPSWERLLDRVNRLALRSSSS